MNLSKKKVATILIIIILISTSFKLYTIDFSIPINSDNLGYLLDALAYRHGDFFIHSKKNSGWPMFIAPFMLLIDSNIFIHYSNMVRLLTIGLSTVTIFTVYILGRKFFDQKYSLVASSLFAFEPHLNYNSGLGLSEPLYVFVMIMSFYLILNKNEKFAYLSSALAGICWWIRLEGFTPFLALSIIFILNFKKSTNIILKYGICLGIFLLVVFPNFLVRYEQFGDPFYFWWEKSLVVEDYGALLTSSTINPTSDYINEKGILSFVYKNFLIGFINIFELLPRMLFPYLIILVPFGILFAFRAFDQNKKYVLANWIMIIVTVVTLSILFAIIPTRRFLLQLYPLLIIFATIPIQRVTEYGLSTFSFTERQKNIFLFIVTSLIIILGGLFTTNRFSKVDLLYENEQIEYARFLVEHLDGRILDGGYALEYLYYAKTVDSAGHFDRYQLGRVAIKDPTLDSYTSGNVVPINVYGKTFEELISNGEKKDLKYIAIVEAKSFFFFPYLNDVYSNEREYPYLIKVFDSNEKGFLKFKVKIFEIDYKKFHQNRLV